MANRPASIRQTDATRLLKAAKAAGYARARLTTHPDGRIELVGEDIPELVTDGDASPFERWKKDSARAR